MKRKIYETIRMFAVNTLATTALSILIMCLFALLQSYTLWGVTVPFEILLVNFLMHAGFYFIQRIELKNLIFSYAVMMIYLSGLLIGFGFLFNWFHANAIWVICLVGFSVFVAAIVIDVLNVNREASLINKKLEQLRKHDGESQ